MTPLAFWPAGGGSKGRRRPGMRFTLRAWGSRAGAGSRSGIRGGLGGALSGRGGASRVRGGGRPLARSSRAPPLLPPRRKPDRRTVRLWRASGPEASTFLQSPVTAPAGSRAQVAALVSRVALALPAPRGAALQTQWGRGQPTGVQPQATSSPCSLRQGQRDPVSPTSGRSRGCFPGGRTNWGGSCRALQPHRPCRPRGPAS